jgi:hypothetical protein
MRWQWSWMVFWVGLLAAPMTVAQEPTQIVSVPKLSFLVTVDGNLSTRLPNSSFAHEQWSNGGRIPWITTQPSTDPDVYGVKSEIFWTQRALFLSFTVRDARPGRDAAPLWTGDYVGLRLDPDRDGRDVFELLVSPSGAFWTALRPHLRTDRENQARLIAGCPDAGCRPQPVRNRPSDAVQVSVRQEPDAQPKARWTVEIRLPWTALPSGFSPPRVDDAWGFNVFSYKAGERPITGRWRDVRWSTSAAQVRFVARRAACRGCPPPGTGTVVLGTLGSVGPGVPLVSTGPGRTRQPAPTTDNTPSPQSSPRSWRVRPSVRMLEEPGDCSQAPVRPELRRRMSLYRRCYERALRENPALSKDLRMTFEMRLYRGGRGQGARAQ